MKVNLGKEFYDVRFRHIDNFCMCTISKVIDPNAKGKENYTAIISATSKCSKLDKFNKVFGFKVAMTKALNIFGKRLRSKFWEEFFKVYSISRLD